jgi:hypothetical protein
MGSRHRADFLDDPRVLEPGDDLAYFGALVFRQRITWLLPQLDVQEATCQILQDLLIEKKALGTPSVHEVSPRYWCIEVIVR